MSVREEQDLPKIVRQAQDDLTQIKNRQPIGSRDIIIRETTTADIWDYDAVVNLVSGPKIVVIYFVADTQVAPFAEIIPTIYLDGSPMSTGDYRFGINSTPNLQAASIDDMDLTQSQRQRLSFMQGYITSTSGYPVNIDLKIKARVLSVDTGTIGVSVA